MRALQKNQKLLLVSKGRAEAKLMCDLFGERMFGRYGILSKLCFFQDLPKAWYHNPKFVVFSAEWFNRFRAVSWGEQAVCLNVHCPHAQPWRWHRCATSLAAD